MNFIVKGICCWICLLSYSLAAAQSYQSWIVGDSTDAEPMNYQPGVLLAGGGGDNDDAMKWMLQRADGGDVLILRASGSDGYNDYFFNDLGVNVHSVETIRFDDASAAQSFYVIRRIREAEVLFLAGGDQYDYYQYWNDNQVETAIRFLMDSKGITVGGTSAGMAVLGEAYYTPSGSSLTSIQGLANPFHPNIDTLGKGDFIGHPFLGDVITDTHYDQRDRQGRQVTFMARLAIRDSLQTFAIACNEYTAVAVDETLQAQVFGDYPDYPDLAYFLQTSCQDSMLPEIIEPDQPLHWQRDSTVIRAYVVPGTPNGSNYLSLADWQTGNGGSWEHWYVASGALQKTAGTLPVCDTTVTVPTALQDHLSAFSLDIAPNPAHTKIWLHQLPRAWGKVPFRVFSLEGKISLRGAVSADQNAIAIQALPSGLYWVQLSTPQGRIYKRFARY